MKNLFLFALAVASLSACKKDSENAPAKTDPKTDLLTAKNWRISAYTSAKTSYIGGAPPVFTTSDDYAFFPACKRDNFVKFNTNKTMVQDEGATKCSSGAAQQENYTWDFNSDQTKLLVTPVGSTTTVTSRIKELSATKLVIRDSINEVIIRSSYITVSDITYTAF